MEKNTGAPTTIRGRILYRIARFTHGIRFYDIKRTENLEGMHSLQYGASYDTADFRAIFYHLIQKTAVHFVLRMIRTPLPEQWPRIFTGSRKSMAEFLLKEYFPYERQRRRGIVLEKVLYLYLKTCEVDTNYAEVNDALLYRLLTQKGHKFFFDNPAALDPANWFMDNNPNPLLHDEGEIKGSRLPHRGRYTPPQEIVYFDVKKMTETHMTASLPLKEPITTLRKADDQFDVQYVALDLAGKVDGSEGVTYPIIARGKNLGQVMDAYRKFARTHQEIPVRV